MKKWPIICGVTLLIGVALFYSHRAHQSSSPSSQNASDSDVAAIEPATSETVKTSEAAKSGEAAKADEAAHQTGEATKPGVAQTGTAALPQEKPKPESNCFVYEFQHKAEAKQKDIEDFMDFTNAFPIAHKDFNAKSVCVKVNQQAVAYKVITTKGQPEVLVGSIVGPESLIRVSYCTGKALCKENCAQPQKRFMDDLVSDADADDDFGESWGNSGDQKKKLQAHVKAFRSVAKENDSLTKQSVIRDWKTVNHQESVCKKEGK